MWQPKNWSNSMGSRLQNVLILAHPGHELRIHHWLEIAKPRVYLLTDGSGGRQSARTEYSRQIVEASGGTPGSVFGEITDAAWYSALLAGDQTFFLDIFARISADIDSAEEVQVVSDAIDGYNPVHDLAFVFGSAVNMLLQKTRKGHPQLCSAAVPNVPGTVQLEIKLDRTAQARKKAAIEDYIPLADEARLILARDPDCLHRERLIAQQPDWTAQTPEWERIGQDRVSKGIYDRCITYKDNVQPIVRLLMSQPDR
ncbi:hypothetical protein FJ957_07435 [Mesorhizobium sp. B2-4-6]|nr:hypothetical protein FJ957_07435 [Mesorhizobium sp. B2-4-6]